MGKSTGFISQLWHQVCFRLKPSLLAVTMALAPSAAVFAKTEPFNARTLKIAIDRVDSMEIGDFAGTTSKDVLLLGRNDDKQKLLQIVSLEQGKASEKQLGAVILDSQSLFYDTATMAGSRNTAILLLQPGKVLQFNPLSGQLKILISAPSIYRASHLNSRLLSRFKMAIDVNNDGLSDLILPDFSQTRIFVQQPNGQFSPPQIIDMPAQLTLYRNTEADYTGTAYTLADHNFDGEVDLIYRVNAELQVFYQQKGVFSPKPQIFPLALQEPLTDEFDDAERDHSNLVTHSVFKMVDLNQDDKIDLITKRTKSAGLLDKSSQYQIYFGTEDSNGVVGYGKLPDSVIASKGLQFELKLQDFDGDGRLDLVSPSYKLGVGSIIASLFSSSFDLDVGFHAFNQAGRYSSKPNLEKELTVDFNLTSGQQVYPLMRVSDFDGDGIKDLLIGNGSKRVYLYHGVKDADLFARRAEKYRIKLPRDGRLVVTEDLNDDGKTDIVIRYGKLDGKTLNKEIKVLIAD